MFFFCSLHSTILYHGNWLCLQIALTHHVCTWSTFFLTDSHNLQALVPCQVPYYINIFPLSTVYSTALMESLTEDYSGTKKDSPTEKWCLVLSCTRSLFQIMREDQKLIRHLAFISHLIRKFVVVITCVIRMLKGIIIMNTFEWMNE